MHAPPSATSPPCCPWPSGWPAAGLDAAPVLPTAGADGRAPRQLYVDAGQPIPHGHTHAWVVEHGIALAQAHDAAASARVMHLIGVGDVLALHNLLQPHAPARRAAPSFTQAVTLRSLSAVRLRRLGPLTAAALQDVLGQALLQCERQALEMAQLRSGPLDARLGRLLELLQRSHAWPHHGWHAQRHARPALRDLALVLDATPEAVCRALARRRRSQGEHPSPLD